MKLSNYDKIEAYLFDLLNEQERIDFEADLNKDENLQTEVNLHRLEHQAIQLLEEENLRAQFAEWKQEKKAVSETVEAAKVVGMNSRRRNFIYRFSAAASLLLFISTLWFANSTYGNQALADAAFEASSSTKGNDTSTRSDFDIAEQAFVEGRYNEVIDIYQNIIANNSNPTEVHLAEWNLANTRLMQGDSKSAKLLLEEIAQNEAHTYQDAAADLLPKLNSFWRKLTIN